MKNNKAPYRIGVSGITGNMGRLIARAVEDHPLMVLSCGLCSQSHPQANDSLSDLGYPKSTGRLFSDWHTACRDTPLDAVVDFSAAEATVKIARICAEEGIRLVSGSTGLSQEQKQALSVYATKTSILYDTNMSLLVHWLMQISCQTVERFPETDIDIIDIHHRMKKDAPSGTALRLSELIMASTPPGESWVQRTDKSGPRPSHTVDIAVVRTGTNASEHTIRFTMENESLQITHAANNRQPYIVGTIKALLFIMGLPPGTPGLFSMRDLF